eukprot:COSAG06_NODE_4972_length_3817_cov_9.879236_3_plen_120_part_00
MAKKGGGGRGSEGLKGVRCSGGTAVGTHLLSSSCLCRRAVVDSTVELTFSRSSFSCTSLSYVPIFSSGMRKLRAGRNAHRGKVQRGRKHRRSREPPARTPDHANARESAGAESGWVRTQ